MNTTIVIISIIFALSSVILYFNLNRFCRNENKKFTFWPIVFYQSNDSDKLKTVRKVFDLFGYEAVDGSQENWDILYSIESPFDLFPDLIDDDLGQRFHKINHFPGITYITSKMAFTTSSLSNYVPAAFAFPQDRRKYQNFALLDEHFMFVVKNSNRGGVKLIKPSQIDKLELNQGKFIQVFIRDQFLIDGHAFDIGIYVLITSLDPLIMYRFTSEFLIRFCPEPYFPFNPLNTRKYVVNDEKLHAWEMPSFKDHDGKFSHLKLFENYYESRNKSVKELWEKLDDAIVTTTLENSQLMADELNNQCSVYNCTNENFFELLRYDFVIGRDGSVHLLEVEMSPDLSPSKPEYDRNNRHYKQVAYNTLRLIGLQGFELFKQELTSNYEDLNIDIKTCKNCHTSCSTPSCNHCPSCMSTDFIKILHNTHRDHQRRGEFKRIFPSKIYNKNSEFFGLMTSKTKELSGWIGFKCEENIDWC